MTQIRRGVLLTVVVLICVMLSSSMMALGPGEATRYTFAIINRYPHDPSAFTQGLVFNDGHLFEGTGLYGQSSLRRISLEDGAILNQVGLEPEFFGEGIAILGDRLFQLTWLEGRGFVYDLPSLERIDEFSYQSEGWGLTTDGEHLIMSHGSNVLTFLDPLSYQPISQLKVTGEDGPIRYLNELEYINGEIFANIWFSDFICRIDPQTGKVLGWIDLSHLCALERAENPGIDVLNGIAYDSKDERLFVTGKLWPHIYEIRLEF